MPNELQLLGRAVKQAQYRQHRALDSRLAAVGTTLAQWDALRAISRAPGAAARTLAPATFQSEQAFGTLAGRLAALGLIERRPGTGRRIEHYLTLRRRGLERGAPDRRRGPRLLLREPVRSRPLRPVGPARARRRFPLKPGRLRAGAAVAGVVSVYALGSRKLAGSPVSAATVFADCGVLIGPVVVEDPGAAGRCPGGRCGRALGPLRSARPRRWRTVRRRQAPGPRGRGSRRQ